MSFKSSLPPLPGAGERIMVFGPSGVGKSFDLYCAARMAINTGSDAQFHIIDTDRSVARMLSDPQLSVLLGEDRTPHPNIHVYDIREIAAEKNHNEWKVLASSLQTVSKVLGPNDWVMIDMMTVTYDWVQEAYTDRVFKKDRSDFFQDKRAQQAAGGKEGGSFSFIDWPILKDMYQTDLMRPIMMMKGHVYATAALKALDDRAGANERSTFGAFGVMPAGEKNTQFTFHTVLWKFSPKQGTFAFTTIKDRARPFVSTYNVDDFAIDYLVNIGGWQL
jgi:hypothetical protein